MLYMHIVNNDKNWLLYDTFLYPFKNPSVCMCFILLHTITIYFTFRITSTEKLYMWEKVPYTEQEISWLLESFYIQAKAATFTQEIAP